MGLSQTIPQQDIAYVNASHTRFVEATSDSPTQPTVLVNAGDGPLLRIELISQMAGNEHCRLVYQNAEAHEFRGPQCRSFLQHLAQQGMWQPSAEKTAIRAGSGGAGDSNAGRRSPV